MMEILKANLGILEARNMKLAQELISYTGPGVCIESAKTGGPTFRHTGRLFHSAYNPEKEAAAQAEEIAAKKPDWVLLFGLGCGHILKAMLEKGLKKVLVYEPSMEILSGVMASVDLSGALAEKDVMLYGDLVSLISKVWEIDGFDTLLSYSATPYKTSFPKELVEFSTKIKNAHMTNKVRITTDIGSREMWIENYFENIKALTQCQQIDSLRGAFNGVPLIIAGAGPSLQKNAHLLREAKGKAVIIAAITAYKPLLKFGVVPDFVIASEKVDLPEYFTFGEEDRNTRLILAEVSHPGMFQRDMKEKYVFFNPYFGLSHSHAGLWGSSYFPLTGGSVTTAALDMGIMMGCDPVVLIGQDLSFGESGTHVKGGVYIAQDVKIDREKGEVSIDEDYVTLKDKAHSSFELLWLKGLDGKPVPSKFDWVTFHQWFENYAAALHAEGSPVRLINATEGGAYIEGMEHIPLAEVIEKDAKNEMGFDNRVSGAMKARTLPDIPALSASIDKMHKGLKEIGRIADCITKEVSSLRKDLDREKGKAAGKKADRIKKLEQDLFSAAEQCPFIWEALSTGIYELKEYLRETRDRSEEVQKDLEAIFQAYRKVSLACAKYMPVLERAADSLKEEASWEASPAVDAAV